jgi:hypothetical protein
MDPLQIACRYTSSTGAVCGAQAGEGCHLDVDAQPMDYRTVGSGLFHSSRIEDAAAMSGGEGREISVEEFDRAVIDSGLF